MNFLLDTNVCIRYLSGRSPAILHRLRTKKLGVVRVCSVVKSEMFYGAMKSQDPIGNLRQQEAFFAPFTSPRSPNKNGKTINNFLLYKRALIMKSGDCSVESTRPIPAFRP